MTPPSTMPEIAKAVEQIEQAVHPSGRCSVCGGGENYWKHNPTTKGIEGSHRFTLPSLMCDDCRKPYPGPAYYTYDREDCEMDEDGNNVPHGCTGNTCSTCCGPYVTPDNPEDDRRPHMTIDEILRALQ